MLCGFLEKTSSTALRRRQPPSQTRAWLGILLTCLIVTGTPVSVLGQDSAARPGLNKYCPVMTDEEADPKITTTYRGRLIAFCCDTCRGKFQANPERYSARLPAVREDAQERPSDTHAAHDPSIDQDGHEHGEQTGAGGQPGPNDTGPQHEHGDGRPPLLARVHPIIVHFPVAGIPLALLGLLARLVTRKEAFAAADVPPLMLAALAAIAAVISGNVAHDSIRFAPALHDYVHWHQYAGTTVMALVLVLAGLRIWRWNRLAGTWLWVYGTGLLATALLIGVTGYLGGSLVFGPDHFAW